MQSLTTRMLTARIGYVRCLAGLHVMHALYLGPLGGFAMATFDGDILTKSPRLGRWRFFRIVPLRHPRLFP